jgi:predicted nuclease of predicted toxin-antitoxin system
MQVWYAYQNASMPIGQNQMLVVEKCIIRTCHYPPQQYSYTVGKLDSAIIDAMDLLYSDKVDGFCIVSSDSDFTRLAIRLRESE